MKRNDVEEVKAEAARLLRRIEIMERCAGWTRFTSNGDDMATSTPHPDDKFRSGHYAAAVHRASLDLTRSLARMRRG